ncbi:peptidylprolyl isomerase [Zwartia vadi]|uniref:peptidylprolyl isomerase n=1 Tax=Zwartia vadi TaxID=3058168 RepID=UPI0025B318B5|nr:peptidylprolyl isomerase [Zwartia vadi]MDN3986895.1 peptidylprolyl isomerase [Zwartia vadi]
MMRSTTRLQRCLALLAFVGITSLALPAAAQLGAPAPAARTNTAQKASGGVDADGIVAVVNKDVITRRELDARVRIAKRELAAQRVQAPPDTVLETQILQRLITETLEQQEARKLRIEVNDGMLQSALEIIAKRNNTTVPVIRKQIEGAGIGWSDYTAMIRRELMIEQLRQRVVDSTIFVSDSEVDAYLREQQARKDGNLPLSVPPPPAPKPPPPPPKPQAATPAIMGLAQILVRVPEGSSEEEIKALRAKAQGLLTRVRRGESFEEVAKSSSDGPEASRGGDMGVRPLSGWPDLFLKGVAGVPDGRISNIIQSANGFHILKVIGRAGGTPPTPKPQPQPQAAPAPGTPGGPVPQGPMPVQQTQARHILIKTTAVVTDEIARQRLAQIRERIVQGGENFSDMAKRYSNDSSAPQGGALGWLNPGETVPPFDKAMNALKIGEISMPVQTQFGWHLIVVDARRTQDMAEQFKRNQARQQIFQQRSNTAFEAWLQQVRTQAFIDNRLEKSLRQSGR